MYGILAALVAATLLVVAGQPRWQVATVIGGALLLIGVLVFSSSRTRQQPPEPTGDRSEPDDGRTEETPPRRRGERHSPKPAEYDDVADAVEPDDGSPENAEPGTVEGPAHGRSRHAGSRGRRRKR